MKHFTRIVGLIFILLLASQTATAGSREDELISMKIEAHASLDTHRNLKEWCEKKYPGTAALAEKVGFYLYPRIEKVERYLFSSERNPEFKRFVEQKLKSRFIQGKQEDIAHFESKYTQMMCENTLNYVLETGIGRKLETYVDVAK
jgi:hypothetical protein